MAGRVLILTQCYPPDVGGIERLMGGLAGALADAGFAVDVYADRARAFGGPEPPTGPQLRRFGGFKPLRRLFKAHAAGRWASHGLAAAVVADSWKSLERVSLPSGANVACLAHGMEFSAAPSSAKSARVSASLAKARIILANSEDTARRAAAFTDRPIAVVHPPAEPPPAADEETFARMRARLGPGPLILTLARLEPRKGVDRVIEALPALPSVARYAVAGDGGDRGRLEALARGAGVADRVVFLGRVTEAEKAALFACADVFAMPARIEGGSVEGFGIVYIEAAFAGVASLAGRDGGAGDAVVDGETGLLCDGASLESVTAALGRLLADHDLRVRLGRAAKARALREFGWPTGIARYRAALGI